jgi:hypothetical protein
VSNDFHEPDRHDRRSAVTQLPLADDLVGHLHDEHPPAGRARPGAYWTGLVVLALGLGIIVLALAARVTSIVQAALLGVPLALVGLGLERVGRGEGRRSLRVVGATLLIVAVVGPTVLWRSSTNRAVINRLSAPVPAGANQTLLRASLGGGQLRIGPGATGLYAAELRGPGRPSAQVTTDNAGAVLDLRAPVQRGLLARNRGSDWTVNLTADLPWRVEVEAGTVTADLNLGQLDVRGVRVETGVSRLAVRLGPPTAEVPVNLQVSSGLVDIYLPRTAACQIRVSGISVDNFADEGLVKAGGVWRTSDTARAGRYLLDVRISGGRVRLHRE